MSGASLRIARKYNKRPAASTARTEAFLRRCWARSSKPVGGIHDVTGGFDPHTLPPVPPKSKFLPDCVKSSKGDCAFEIAKKT